MKTILTTLLGIFTVVVVNAQCEVFITQTIDETTGVFTAHFFEGEDSIMNTSDIQFVWEIENLTLTGDIITYEFSDAGDYMVCVTATSPTCSDTFCNTYSVSNGQVEDSCNLFLTYDITHATSADINDGAIDITVQGGIAPYSYSWGELGFTEDISDLYPGYYGVEISDYNGCALLYTFYVAAMNDSTYNDTTVADYIYAGAYYEFDSENDCSAEVWAEVYGGTPPYTYLWSNQEAANSFYGACSGDFYCVTVTDAEGLEAEACVTIDYYNYQDSTWVINDSLETTVDTCLDIVYGEIVEYVIDNNIMIVTWEFTDSNDEVTQMVITYPAEDSITPGIYEVYLYVNCNDVRSLTTYSDWVQVNEEQITGIISPAEGQNYNIYPNPVSNTLNIDLFANENDNTEIQILNTAGQVVYSTTQTLNNGQNNLSFDVNSLTKGVYFIKINGSNTYETKKFVK